MLTMQMKEKNQSTCHIGEIDDEILALVLDFMYTKKIWVNQDMLSDLLAVGDYFRMKAFGDEIENSLVGLVSYENCVTMWITGKKFEKEKLMQQSERTICAHVRFVANNIEFRNLDQHYMEDFMKLIKEKVSDDQYMKCALLWIKHDMDKRMEKFEMFYDMIEPKSLSQSTWVLLINMKKLVSQNFAAAKAVIPYMQQFVPNAETELALGTMYVLCQRGDVYSCDMSGLKSKASDNNSIFVPKWMKIKTAESFVLNQRSPLIYGFQKLYAIGNHAVLSLNNAKWQDEVLLTHQSSEAVAFVGDTLYVAGGTFNCKLESYKKDFSGQRTTQHTSMKFGRSCFVLVPYDVYGNDTIQVATFDLGSRQWVPGMNAEAGIVERCASLTLGFPDFGSCTMGPPPPVST